MAFEVCGAFFACADRVSRLSGLFHSVGVEHRLTVDCGVEYGFPTADGPDGRAIVEAFKLATQRRALTGGDAARLAGYRRAKWWPALEAAIA